VTHLLVTNDFPPKVGGIQSYLIELWSRLPEGEAAILTTAHPGAAAWDGTQALRIERVPSRVLVPSPQLVDRIERLADAVGADLVLIDPAWPLGLLGPLLSRPFGVVVHGAEVTIPARLPFVQLTVRSVLRRADLIVAAGDYPAAQVAYSAGPSVPVTVIPPGVDHDRFHPLDDAARAAVRGRFGVDPSATVVLGVSRLVKRKGFDVLIEAVGRLDGPERIEVVLAGEGRDRGRLEEIAHRSSVPVRFLGAVAEADLPDLYGCADVFAMLCRDQRGGLEQEGFGIVFLEAAAAGLPVIAGRSGGSADAVAHGVTGLVVDDPRSVDDAVAALDQLLADPATRARMGAAGQRRAVNEFDHEAAARRLGDRLHTVETALRIDAPATAPVEDVVVTGGADRAP
jgi:phosphatidylinositol alpha-1,6-mannosyltransferase